MSDYAKQFATYDLFYYSLLNDVLSKRSIGCGPEHDAILVAIEFLRSLEVEPYDLLRFALEAFVEAQWAFGASAQAEEKEADWLNQ